MEPAGPHLPCEVLTGAIAVRGSLERLLEKIVARLGPAEKRRQTSSQHKYTSIINRTPKPQRTPIVHRLSEEDEKEQNEEPASRAGQSPVQF